MKKSVSLIAMAGLFLMLSLMGVAVLHGDEPAGKRPPPKVRLVPRALPGTSAVPGRSAARPMSKSAPQKTTAAEATRGEVARILGVLRRGTFPATAPPSTPEPIPDATVTPKPAVAVPPEGRVRILTKQEAEAIAAQPKP